MKPVLGLDPRDDYCFQPIHIYDSASGKPILSPLRPGKRPSGAEAALILRHVIRRIRDNWPRVEIVVRGDGHYGAGEVMDLLEEQGCGDMPNRVEETDQRRP